MEGEGLLRREVKCGMYEIEGRREWILNEALGEAKKRRGGSLYRRSFKCYGKGRKIHSKSRRTLLITVSPPMNPFETCILTKESSFSSAYTP